MGLSARSHSKSKFRVVHRRKKNRKPIGALLWLALIGIALSYWLLTDKKFEDVITTDSDGNLVLSEERQAELAQRQRKNSEEAEQYILIALAPGYRLCYLCPEGKAWLEAGEIAKIGVSTNGRRRYSRKFYRRHNVDYATEYIGDLVTARNREIARLGAYPLLPENLKREYKLLYPPLNAVLD